QLEFIGSVGTGFDHDAQNKIYEQMKELRQPDSPLSEVPKLKEAIEWVEPRLVARVKYGNWTDGDRLRAPVFLSLRDDLSPTECTVEAGRPNEAQHVESKGKPARNGRQVEVMAAMRARKSKTIASDEKPIHAIDSTRKQTSLAAAAKSGETVVSRNIEEAIRKGSSEGLNVEVDGRVLRLTHLNKVYFPESGIRKRDLLAYYFHTGHLMLPFLKDRPMVLRRYPNGIQEKAFFQKEAPDSIAEWLDRAIVHSEERGGDMPYVMANDLAALLYLTNLGCIDHNPWSSRSESQGTPDYVFFDLDPTPGTPFTTVLQIARTIQTILQSIRLTSFLKTSGASGFHIFVPLKPEYTYEQTRVFAELVGRMASDELPGLITFERMVHKRPRGKVLMDALQNARGKPLAAVYSVRAYPHAPVSMPLTATELKRDFSPEQWNLNTLDRRLKDVGDLWKDFWNKRQSLSGPLELLDRRLSGNKSVKTR
ncbi:MAG: non-homologous end-joining DNA ligase, partial [Candidatus Acidiferrum sp.]